MARCNSKLQFFTKASVRVTAKIATRVCLCCNFFLKTRTTLDWVRVQGKDADT